jgi:hypothetical protein
MLEQCFEMLILKFKPIKVESDISKVLLLEFVDFFSKCENKSLII